MSKKDKRTSELEHLRLKVAVYEAAAEYELAWNRYEDVTANGDDECRPMSRPRILALRDSIHAAKQELDKATKRWRGQTG